MNRLQDKSLILCILKLACNGHVYSIWCGRNARTFMDDSKSIIDIIDRNKNFVCINYLRIMLIRWIL
ncbi:hypothetical protein GQ457_06G040140 [Hibiscus cannabinus]